MGSACQFWFNRAFPIPFIAAGRKLPWEPSQEITLRTIPEITLRTIPETTLRTIPETTMRLSMRPSCAMASDLHVAFDAGGPLFHIHGLDHSVAPEPLLDIQQRAFDMLFVVSRVADASARQTAIITSG